MSTSTPYGNRSSATTRHTKEDALDAREFEELVAATYELSDYYALQCRFALFAAGRLGMRAGEIAHMTEEWVDWRRSMIVVPAHEVCTNGHGDGLCAYCKKCARQKAEAATETELEEMYQTLQPGDELEPGAGRGLDCCYDEADFYHTMWSPKTDAAAREIPFDADVRASIEVEKFFGRFDEWPNGRQSVNRRVKKAARHADGVQEAGTYPHCLRATAASYWSDRGLDIFALKAMMGWACLDTAKVYVTSSGERTARAIRDVQ